MAPKFVALDESQATTLLNVDKGLLLKIAMDYFNVVEVASQPALRISGLLKKKRMNS